MSDETWSEVTLRSVATRNRPAGCSFCGKSQDKAGKMVGGREHPGWGQAFICKSCVRLCLDVIEEDATPQ